MLGKDLFLLRHGFAEERNPQGDFARNLTRAGQEHAVRVAQQAATRYPAPESWLSSPSQRTLQTVSAFASAWQATIPLRSDPRLWWPHGSYPALEAILDALTHAQSNLWVCGHEPVLSEVALTFDRSARTGFPRCGILQIHFSASTTSGTMVDHLFDTESL